MSPPVFAALFAGMHVERGSPDHELALLRAFEEHVRRADPHARVSTRCFVAPYHERAATRAWADYMPRRGELRSQTSHVRDVQGQLRRSMREAWPWLEARVREGGRGAVIGVSNGGIPAAAAALFFGLPALVLVSGLPALEQQEELARQYQGKTLMSVGRGDRVFGGSPAYYGFAERVAADVAAFPGGHAAEPEGLMMTLGRAAARHAISSASGGDLV
jgi:hypothetical protein